MTERLVSIIVPVYGVELFLDKCVESMVNQTYKPLQIILVDDESPDTSPQKCDTWARRDSRIEVIHIKNQGVSVARNIALEHACGDYIAFVDADDFIEPEMIERMVRSAEQNDSQIVFCGNTREIYCGDGLYRNLGHGPEMSFAVKKNLDFRSYFCDLSDYSYTRPVWNKLYKREFVEAFSSPFSTEVTAGSDAIFNYALYPHADRVSCIADAPYHYVTREGSIAGKYNPRLFESRKYGYKYVRPILEEWCPEALDGFDNLFLSELDLVPIYLYADKRYSVHERHEELKALLCDSDLNARLREIRPHGFRNTVSKLVLTSSNVMLVAAYGRCVNAAKQLYRFIRRL